MHNIGTLPFFLRGDGLVDNITKQLSLLYNILEIDQREKVERKVFSQRNEQGFGGKWKRLGAL